MLTRPSRKGDRRQLEGVDDGQAQGRETRVLALQLWQIVSTQVVADQQLGSGGCGVDPPCDLLGAHPAGREADCRLGVGPHRTDLEDASVVSGIGLDVDRDRGGVQQAVAWTMRWTVCLDQ